MAAPSVPECHRAAVRSALGPSAKLYAVAAARVYVCGPRCGGWSRVGTGALVFGSVRRAESGDKGAKTYVLALVAVDGASHEFGFEGRPRWTHDVADVSSLVLVEERPFFYALEYADARDVSEDVGLCFASAGEARAFAGIFAKRLKRAARPGFFARLFGSGSSGRRSAQPSAPPRKASDSATTMATAQSRLSPPAPKQSGNTSKLNSHGAPPRASVVCDEKTGTIDTRSIPDEWRAVFARAGVTPDQLAAPETAAVIAAFCADNSGAGGRPAVPPRRRPPPPPAAKSGADSRSAPPPPPPQKTASAPPPSTASSASGLASGAASSTVTAAAPASSSGGGRDALLASIRQASIGSLRHVEERGASRDSLGDASPPDAADAQDIMAAMLAKALAARSRRMAASSDDD